METTLAGKGSDKPTRKGNIVLKGLTKEQKQKLMSGATGLAGIAVGAGAFALMGFMTTSGDADANEPGGGEAAVVCTEAAFAESVTDNMSFQQAFEAARQEVGAGGFFEYKGTLYNTYTRDEWENMTPDEQQQYWGFIDKNTTSITDVETHQADEITIETPIEPVIAGTNEKEQVPGGGGDSPAEDVILEVDYVAQLDVNEDGYADVIIVDANGNELPDLILDDNFDGVADRIVMDVNLYEGLTGKEQEHSLEDTEVKINYTDANEDDQAPVLTVNYITEVDTDDDGSNDVMMVDADGNDTPELLIDNDGDGTLDTIMYDVDFSVGITGNEQEYELEGVELNIVGRQDSQAADEEEPVLTVNYINQVDADGDGYDDIMIVDADGNDTPELLIDYDGDSQVDTIMYDVDLSVGITGNEQEYELEGIVLEIVDGEDANRVTNNDLEADYLSEEDLNPGGNTEVADSNAPNFDNDYDVTDYS